MKPSILSTFFSGLLGSLASATTIANFNFENYAAVNPTWWGNDSTNISAGGGGHFHPGSYLRRKQHPPDRDYIHITNLIYRRGHYQTGNATGTFAVTYNGNAMRSGILDSDDNFNGGNDAFTSNTIASSVSGTVNFVVSVDPDAASRTARWDNFVVTGDIVAVPEPSSSALVIFGGLAMTFLRRRR